MCSHNEVRPGMIANSWQVQRVHHHESWLRRALNSGSTGLSQVDLWAFGSCCGCDWELEGAFSVSIVSVSGPWLRLQIDPEIRVGFPSLSFKATHKRYRASKEGRRWFQFGFAETPTDRSSTETMPSIAD